MPEFVHDFSEAVRKFESSNLFTDANIKRILSAGIAPVYEDVRASFVSHGHNRTGETLRHIVSSRKPRRGKDKKPYMFVSVRGKDAKGQPYRTKGFATNYGRLEESFGRRNGRIVGDRWFSDAAARAQEQSLRAMEAEIKKILEGD